MKFVRLKLPRCENRKMANSMFSRARSCNRNGGEASNHSPVRLGPRLADILPAESAPIDDYPAVANFDRALTVGCSVFAKVFPQGPGTIFPVKHVSRYRLVVNGDAAQRRIFQCLRAVALNLDVTIQIITTAPNVFAQWHARLNVQAVAFYRHENLATSMPIVRNQIVQIVCC